MNLRFDEAKFRSPVPTLVVALAAAIFGCHRADAPSPDLVVDAPASTSTSTSDQVAIEPIDSNAPIQFEDASASSRLDRFIHHSGQTPERRQPETHGSGLGFVDLDSDGLLDLFLLTCNPLFAPPEGQSSACAAFRNLGNATFEEVSANAGLALRGFPQGVSVADLDNDGFPDLVVTGFREGTLLRNRGDGTFGNAQGALNPPIDFWSTASACLDFDRDGDLDLYLAGYADWSPEKQPFCGDQESGLRTYCRPTYFDPIPHRFFRSEGNWRWVEVSKEIGLSRADGRGLGVIAADLDADGWTDLYVANDMTENFLYYNTGNGQFLDRGVLGGAATDAFGKSLASMGVDAEDLDGDLAPELFCTNFYREPNSIFRNLGNRLFTDASSHCQLGVDSVRAMGWGAALVDLDADTLPDVIVTNGHLDDMSRTGQDEPFRQPAQVWHNEGSMSFREMGRSAGPYFGTPRVGRGLAVGDVNQDGRPDVALNPLDEPASLLINRSPTNHNRMTLKLTGTLSPRDPFGSVVDVTLASADSTNKPASTLRRHLKGGGSYYSANACELYLGLGPASRVERLTVRWPSGATQKWDDLASNEAIELVEGRLSPVRIRVLP